MNGLNTSARPVDQRSLGADSDAGEARGGAPGAWSAGERGTSAHTGSSCSNQLRIVTTRRGLYHDSLVCRERDNHIFVFEIKC